MDKTYEEKLNWLVYTFGHSFTDQIDDNPEAINHYYKATRDYDMGISDADGWAWLNTLLRYDIGADHALGIIDWLYTNEDATVMDVIDVNSRDKLEDICKELGYHLNFSHWAEKEPGGLEFGFKEYLVEKRVIQFQFDALMDEDAAKEFEKKAVDSLEELGVEILGFERATSWTPEEYGLN